MPPYNNLDKILALDSPSNTNENPVSAHVKGALDRLTNAGISGPQLTYALGQLHNASSPEHVAEIEKRINEEIVPGSQTAWQAAKSLPGQMIDLIRQPGVKSKVIGSLGLGLSPIALGMAGLDTALGQGGATNMQPSEDFTPGNVIMGALPMGLAAKGSGVGTNLFRNTLFQHAVAAPIGEKLGPAGELGAWILGGGLRAKAAGNALPSIREVLANERGSIVNPRGGLESLSGLYDKAIGQKISAVAAKAGELPLGGEGNVLGSERIKRVMGGNTLKEWFTHPVDRLIKNKEGSEALSDVGKKLYNTALESDRVSRALGDAGLNLAAHELTLAQREDFHNVIKYGMDISKAKPENVDLIANILAPYQSALKHTASKLLPDAKAEQIYAKSMDEGLMKMLTMDTQNPAWDYHKQMWGGNLNDPKEVRKFLKTTIDNPNVHPDLQRIAVDLYDLPERTAVGVGTANRHALEDVLFAQIKNDPSMVRDVAAVQTAQMDAMQQAGKAGTYRQLLEHPKSSELKDFVPIPGNKTFEGYLVHKDVAEGIRDLEVTTSAARRIWSTYFLNPWKASKVLLNPPARLRDLFTNVIFNDVAGQYPLSPFNAKVYNRALMDIKRKNSPLLKEFLHWSGGDVEALSGIATRPLLESLKHNAGPVEAILAALYNNPVTRGASNITQFVDLWTKYAKFLHNVDNGMIAEEAAIDAIRTVGDHFRQTRATKFIRDTTMPFFGWQVHAIKTMGSGIAHHPVRVAKWFALPYMLGQVATENLGLNAQDWEDIKRTMPDYIKDEVFGFPTHIPMPHRDDKGRIQMMDLAWWLPGLQDIADLNHNASSPMRFFQNPAFTFGAALYNNKKFSGAPIWREWEDPSTKTAKFLGYCGQQMLPSWTPGIGTAWTKIADSLDAYNEDALTLPEALGTQVGYKVTPFDEDAQRRKFQSMLKNQMNEAKAQMKHELAREGDPAKQDEIINEYQSIFERLQNKLTGEGE